MDKQLFDNIKAHIDEGFQKVHETCKHILEKIGVEDVAPETKEMNSNKTAYVIPGTTDNANPVIGPNAEQAAKANHPHPDQNPFNPSAATAKADGSTEVDPVESEDGSVEEDEEDDAEETIEPLESDDEEEDEDQEDEEE